MKVIEEQNYISRMPEDENDGDPPPKPSETISQ